MPKCVIVVPATTSGAGSTPRVPRIPPRPREHRFPAGERRQHRRDTRVARRAGSGQSMRTPGCPAPRMQRREGRSGAPGLARGRRLGARYAGFWDADLATPLEAISGFVGHLDADSEVQMIFGPGAASGPPDRTPAGSALSRSHVCHDRVARAGRAPVRHAVRGEAVPLESRGRASFPGAFRSRWIFDVEIVARFLSESHAVRRRLSDTRERP